MAPRQFGEVPGNTYLNAEDVAYGGSATSGLTATNMEEAIDQLHSQLAEVQIKTITVLLDGAGVDITTGAKNIWLTIPYTGTITRWRLLADQTGSIVLDLWKDTYANFPPTVADSITASAKPTISSDVKAQSSVLTGWTTLVSEGDILDVAVDSCSGITRVLLTLYIDCR